MEQRRCSANRYPIPRSTAQKLPHFLHPAASFLISWSETAPTVEGGRSTEAKTETERHKSLSFLYSERFTPKYLAHTGTVLILGDSLICVGNNACCN